MSTERLLEIKDQIDTAKNRKAGVEGQIEGIEGQMQTKFKIKGLPAAEKRLKAMGVDLDKTETEFTAGMERLEEAYSWE